MKNRQSKTARKLVVKTKTQKYLLGIALLCLIAVVCLLFSRTAEASVSVARTGAAPNFTVTFNNDGNAPVDNRLELRFNAANQLEFSLNGAAFTNNLGGGATATFANIQTIVTNFGSGSNILIVDLTQFAFNVTVTPDSGNSQQTDIVLTDTNTNHTVSISSTSAKVVHFTGVDDNDNLTVNTGQGDSMARIDNGAVPLTDEVKATDLPSLLEFEHINAFTYRSFGIGTDLVTFATQNLTGAQTFNASLDGLDTLVIEGDDSINDNYTITRPAVGQVKVTDSTPSPAVAVTISQIGSNGIPSLLVKGLGGNDQLNINVGAAVGSDVIPNSITFDGGAGNDIVDVFGAPATAVDNVTHTPGPTLGEGHLRYDNVGGTQLMNIDFYNTESSIDLVQATKLTAKGTDDANAINYSAVQLLGAGGRVSVDNFTPIEFSNKTNLIINALGGSDLVNLNNPTTPPGLTGTITVNGGDPTGSDTLVVNGLAGKQDDLRYLPTAVGAGTIVNDKQPQPNVLFTGVEHLNLVLQQADGDGVRVDGTIGNDALEFFHGATPDSGTFTGTMDQNNATNVGPFTMTPMSYTGASPLANDADVNFFNPGGTDSFAFNGTSNDDTIQIATGEAGGTEFRDTVNGIVISRIEVFNISSGVARGFDGNDTFNLILPAGSASVALRVEGGAANDTLNYTAPAGNSTITDYELTKISSVLGNPVTFNSTETINETLSGANPILFVTGTNAGDNITFTPTGNKAGTVSLAGLIPTINFTGASTFTTNGLDGDDSFNITPSSTVAVNVFGNNPTPPASPGDSLNVNTAGATGVSQTNTSGPNGLIGTFTFTNRMPINFQQIETLSSLVVSPTTINVFEGVPFSNQTVATFNAGAISASNFTATIDWGDGTASSAGTTASTGNGAFTVKGGHTYMEEGSFNILVKVTDSTTGATQQATSTAIVTDAPLVVAPLNAGSNQTFMGVGGNNTSVTAGTANAAFNAFKAAIGGADNGANPPPQATGFRTINWDAVKLDGTDFGGNTTVVSLNKTVGIPINRFQARGVSFEEVYAVSGDGFQSVNPGVAGQFPAFSPNNTFAMFNDNTIDFSFVLPSAPNTPPIQAVSRGFGAIFLDVETDNTTSIECFSNGTSLGKFFVPKGTTGQAEFFGVLFQNPAITNVHIELGNATLFSFDGTTVTPGPADNPPATDLAVTDDFAYAEPTGVQTGININTNVGAPTTAKVASFTDMDPNGQLSDYTATIDWGDGTAASAGTILPNAGGGFDVIGTHTFAATGTFTITTSIKDVGGSSISAKSTATVGAQPSLSVNNVSVTEGNSGTTPATFTVTLSAASSQTVTVDYNTSNGTATAPSDYTSANGTLTFAPGQTTRTITVFVNGDTTPEGDETFFVNLMNATNATIATAQGTGTITDDDPGGVMNFSASSYNVNENAGTATITVTRTGSLLGNVTVNFATSNGTAIAGSDYGNTSGTLFFGPGDTSMTFTVPIIDDTLSEGTETVNLTLSIPTGGAVLGSQSTATLFILDNEAPPPPDLFVVTVNNNLLRLNANAPGTILSSVAITGLQPGENVLNIDFRPATGQLYALGSTSRLYTINTTTGAATQVGSAGAFTLSGTDFGADFNPAVDRLRVVSDADQNLRINPNDGTLTATDTTLSYAAGDPNFGANPNITGSAYTNNSAGAATTTLYGIDSNLDILVRQGSTDGSPVSPNSGQLFTVGSLGVNTTGLAGFDIRQTNNTAYASMTSPGDTSSKLYTINLSTGAATLIGVIGGPALIRDIALAPAGSFQFSTASATVGENAGKLTVTINRTGDTTGTASVNVATADGTATQRGDYSIRLATITFNPGDTSKTVDIFIIDDGFVESPETFTVNLSNPTGDFTLDGTSTMNVAITDNDASATNPIANTSFFVRQHYIDFLNREPDPPGLAGWISTLNNCAAGNTTCDRVTVSSAFYLSDEFQGRGYFLYRFYKAALARNPTYREFMMDLSRTTGFLTDAQLEANKVAFIVDFMSRQEFRNKYDAVTDPTAYVKALEQSAGVTLASEQTLITGLQNQTESRATVLRKVIESPEVTAKFFNEAFVVEAYFGYLRRDPDAAFQGWLQLLNQTGDRRALVSGFVNSNEYVQRFGP